MTAVAEYLGYRELFANLTLRELRAKYRRSALGWAWSMLNPLTTMLVYTVVFALFLRIQPPAGNPSGLRIYAIYLMCAMLPWNFFSTCVTGSIATMIGNGALIKKTYFPRQLLPTATVGANLALHVIEMFILTGVIVAFGNWRALPYLPVTLVLVLILAVFALGFGLLFGVLNVFFRDIEHFTTIFFLIWMYLTPIIYPEYLLTHRSFHGITYLAIDRFNPMTDFADAFRATMYNGRLPSLGDWGAIILSAGVILFIGMKVFAHFEGRLAEEL